MHMVKKVLSRILAFFFDLSDMLSTVFQQIMETPKSPVTFYGNIYNNSITNYGHIPIISVVLNCNNFDKCIA